MSESRNHHFVSQVHIKKFFNKERSRIFVYDKKLKNHYPKKSEKRLFSEIDLNTSIKNNSLDFNSLESDLNTFFETDFTKHYNIIKSFIENKSFTKNVNDSLLYFAKYGAIADVRNPKGKKDVDDAIIKAFTELSKNGTEKFKNEIDKSILYTKKAKYSNTIQYSKFANDVINKMGDIIFIITIPQKAEDFFLLPDFCAGMRREKINEYFNPDLEELAYIGLALDSKTYIEFYSSKIKGLNFKSGLFYIDSEIVYELNKINYDYCDSKVACENEFYLKHFINRASKNI